MLVSLHVADVGTARAVRRLGGPGKVPGLLHADAGVAAGLRRRAPLPRPRPGRLGLIAFWQDADALAGFVADHPYARPLADGWMAQLEPTRAFGSWPGLGDDVPRPRNAVHDGPAVVITFGWLRLPRAAAFVRASGPAERAAVEADGFVWGTALARPPFVSTVSVWESADAAAAYAYGARPSSHRDAVAADRERGFHERSAFVRFRPLEVRGSLRGSNPLSERLVSAS